MIVNRCLKPLLRCCCLLIAILFPWASHAQGKMVQVDLLIFTHPSNDTSDSHDKPMLTTNLKDAIPLQGIAHPSRVPYHRLPTSMSHLQREYWTLRHQPTYQIVAFESWLQPSTNRSTVILPNTPASEWSMEGGIRVLQSNYYLFTSELLFSKHSAPKTSFIFKQHQRLKPNQVYYIDHPEAGMLIKVSKTD